MKLFVIIETEDYEKAWNAFRFATAAKGQNHDVKVFLMGEAVECEGLTHEKFNVDAQRKIFEKMGGEVFACGICLKSRQLEDSTSCPVSTMLDCLDGVAGADKVLTF